MTENRDYLKHVSFVVESNKIFKSSKEMVNWISDNHPLEMKGEYNCDAPYENLKIMAISDDYDYQVHISFDTRYPDISDETIEFDVMFLVENIDDDGNYPVRGQLVNLTLVPDTLVISKKKSLKK